MRINELSCISTPFLVLAILVAALLPSSSRAVHADEADAIPVGMQLGGCTNGILPCWLQGFKIANGRGILRFTSDIYGKPRVVREYMNYTCDGHVAMFKCCYFKNGYATSVMLFDCFDAVINYELALYNDGVLCQVKYCGSNEPVLFSYLLMNALDDRIDRLVYFLEHAMDWGKYKRDREESELYIRLHKERYGKIKKN